LVLQVLAWAEMHASGAPPHVPPAQQYCPAAPHALHVPDSQTLLAPQAVPFARLVPVSVHDGVPLEQSVVPVWHALVGVHEAPCVHALHIPLPQTLPVPQDVPFATSPVGVQTGVPFEQSMAPVRHGTEGEHGVPVVHVPPSVPGAEPSDVAPSLPGMEPESVLSESSPRPASTAMPASVVTLPSWPLLSLLVEASSPDPTPWSFARLPLAQPAPRIAGSSAQTAARASCRMPPDCTGPGRLPPRLVALAPGARVPRDRPDPHEP
jgi:hypothetical protein